MDFDRYQNLHTIVMLRDVIRKWWRTELSVADKTGAVLDWSKGDINPPPNDFCRLSLFSKEGFRRCTQSVRVLHEKFKDTRKLRRSQFHDCHLGFTIVGAPLYINGEYEGMLFVEGFARQEVSPREAETLKSKIRELNNGATDLERAVERIPLMSVTEVEKISDLLEFGVNEIANYENEVQKRDETIQTLSSELTDRYKFENIVGKSGPMIEVFKLLEKVCNSDSTVLINGESGTGKELVARAIHYNGPRKDKPFVVQNCSAFNDNLLESALFGHVKGSFTGALRDKPGLFETADEGTFFLDEVGDMSPSLQVKLLRVLQEGTFMPVGGNTSREVNVRVIAATHKDLGDMVKRGEFREDLYYRINVICLNIPALRSRGEDAAHLAEHFAHRFAHEEGVQPIRLAAPIKALLAAYRWPGNVRELKNLIERLTILYPGREIGTTELPPEIARAPIAVLSPATAVPTSLSGEPASIGDALACTERELLLAALRENGGHKGHAADTLGISRHAFKRRLQRLGIQ